MRRGEQKRLAVTGTRYGGPAPRRGNGALSVLWFVMMLASVSLMYYYYLKSQRLEREVRELRKAHAERTATSVVPFPSPEVVPEGAPPPEESTETSSSVRGEAGIQPSATPLPQSSPVATVEVAHTPAVTPPPEPSVTPSPSGDSSSAKEKPKGGTKSSAGEEKADSRGSSQDRPKPKSTQRPSRISSIYDLQQGESNR